MAQEKWADFLISAVRYSTTGTHIDAVKVHQDRGTQVGMPGEALSRPCVVSLLKIGASMCTITRKGDGPYDRGADVEVVTVDGVNYLKTRRDATKADNLGRLPRF